MEIAAAIPSQYKVRRGEGKYIFKRALRGLVPDEVLDRPKMGFSIPIDRWFRGELRSVGEAKLLASDSFVSTLFEVAPIRRWWDEHQRGIRDHSYTLWALLMLESWGRRFGGRLR
jgi:asparagine synthase (glutamine-hydrolysing)